MKKDILKERSGADRTPVGIEVASLSKAFGSQSVLKDISLSVNPGEIFVIMGPSGSGKSVLLRQIAGLDLPTTGTVRQSMFSRRRLSTSIPFMRGMLMSRMIRSGGRFAT